MGWLDRFKKKDISSSVGASEERSAEWPSMHILALDPHTGAGPYAVHEENSSTSVLPAVTTNGRISFLYAGSTEYYERILQDVHNRVLNLPKDSASYICLGVSVTGKSPSESLLIYEVLGSPTPVPELGQIYLLLTNLRTVGDDNWIKTEKYLQSEPVRSWINGVIEIWKRGLNWTQLVQSALESQIKGRVDSQ